MRIAVDAAGGLHAPGVAVRGVLAALRHKNAPDGIVLVGTRDQIEHELGAHYDPRIEIVDAGEPVTEAEPPLKGLLRKPHSSIVIAHQLVKQERAAAVVSAGSTGAQLAAAVLQLGKLRWLLKPALGAVIPRKRSPGFLLDVGANPTVNGIHLVQFAAMGSVFAETVLDIKKPRVALLSNGEEMNKGTDAVRTAHQILSRARLLRFVGNIEGGDVFADKADVIVTDGFTGNVILKFAESLPEMLGAAADDMLRALEPSRYGGVPILGVRGVSVVCHGRSNEYAVAAAILEAQRMVRIGLTEKMERLAAQLRWQRFLLRARRRGRKTGKRE